MEKSLKLDKLADIMIAKVNAKGTAVHVQKDALLAFINNMAPARIFFDKGELQNRFSGRMSKRGYRVFSSSDTHFLIEDDRRIVDYSLHSAIDVTNSLAEVDIPVNSL